MELTREVITALAECTLFNCNKCKASKFCGSMSHNDIEKSLASELLAEMDKPDLWKDAPCDAWHMRGYFTDRDENKVGEFSYHRTPPDSRIDEIAEEYSCDTPTCHPMINGRRAVDVIRDAILKDREEREGK